MGTVFESPTDLRSGLPASSAAFVTRAVADPVVGFLHCVTSRRVFVRWPLTLDPLHNSRRARLSPHKSGEMLPSFFFRPVRAGT